MNMAPALILEDRLHIPADLGELPTFRRWASSAEFPDEGRIDFLDGTLELEMSPEDLHTHGAVKTAMAAALHQLVADEDLGEVFIDRARVSSPAAGLSVEPDVVVVLWRSLEAERVRYVAGSRPGRYVEIEGAVDVVVEIVSDGSVDKDTVRLPRLYAKAGIPELWRVDARGDEVDFRIFRLTTGGYHEVPASADGGWVPSPVLGRDFQLHRWQTRRRTWRYELRRRETTAPSPA